VDHIVAVADGGSNDWDNLRAACRTCNGQGGAQIANDRRADRYRYRVAVADYSTRF
jgi:5-methylcytosine-specific restriction endonuclease McrA